LLAEQQHHVEPLVTRGKLHLQRHLPITPAAAPVGCQPA
jgi:hypothetical protein